MGPSSGVMMLVILVAASASPTAKPDQENHEHQHKGAEGSSMTVSSTVAPVKQVIGNTHNQQRQQQHLSPLHKRSGGFVEQLFSDPPGGEMPYFPVGDRRRSNARFVRTPIKRSNPMRSLMSRNKRESNADDDALALLALWASAANRDDLSLLNSLREAYPQPPTQQHLYEQALENLEPQEEEPEIVLPADEEPEPYPRYTSWSEGEYVVPERFTVMRRSPGGLLPILPSYHKRDEGRWGAFAPQQRKRFLLAKRSPVSQGDVYSLAQMLGEEQAEPNVPVYRRLML
ncbi:uncharacterized protein LOC132198147 isoform X2 [Neocloeon triangulifer]|uniref:uncharacterized protein LOC132198147 isoform X2 n=1 Tax=Neocloeon triangulifer TaxID=2078957 RepID=UPI00286F9CDF|nr:uncharacterized protein LOC132198147 isoform X2 [Neocloeon triangulifer]